MMLLRTELRRLRLRRLVWLFVVAGILGSFFVLFTTWASAQPITDEMREQAEAAYQRELENWEEDGEQMVADCLEQEELEAEAQGGPVDFGCDQMEPQREWFLPYETTLAQHVNFTGVPTAVMVLGIVGLAIGTTAVAAEFSSGAMATLLTFQPRRLRVYAAKVGAVALTAVPLSLLLTGILAVGMWAVYEIRGLDASVDDPLVWTAVRALLLLPAAAVVGAVLAFLVRSTAVVLAVVAGFAIAWEAIGVNVAQALTPFSIRANLMGWLQYGHTYWVQECEAQADGMLVCDGIEHTISFAWSAGFLAVVGVALLAVGALVFRRRDLS
ncbi:ABC transporter permease [Ruania suaedae]|uniref:ABC transporter permease subunit n=1 Tax=Ruania suaedae TaxID=2897774 RepID=UPI001E57E0B3|nr:ABC transporter permease subunit [Ruania suaedae]UFU04011.1 ABC transporter permease [Ruania suaedae]